GGAVASNARGIGARSRNTGAQAQARFARDMGQQNQPSMRTPGRGFESSVAGGGENIGDPNAIGMGGAGTGDGAQDKSIPKPSSGNTKEVKPPEPPKTYDVTPYKKEMALAKMLLMVAAGLLYYASTLSKGKDVDVTQATRTLVTVLCWLAVAMGAYVVLLGVTIAGGKYGQKAQGAILGVGGLAVIAGAYMTMGTGSDGKTLVKAGSYATFLAGAAGLIALMGTMMAKPKTCKSTEMNNPDKCVRIERSRPAPSERALEEYLS
ncbi:MAG: hypothetical protein AAB262_12940, partial [Elusimicrobiota bacterium]